MNRIQNSFSAAFLLPLIALSACQANVSPTPSTSSASVPASTSGSVTIKGDVWVDNWFSLSLNDKPLVEDSVPITTERSFNAESFTFKADYPFVLAFVLKDYKADDTGLEYLRTPQQQMGDGGWIAQFRDTSTNKLIAVSNAQWRCKVIHKAPLDTSCAKEGNPVAGKAPCTFTAQDEPQGWKQLGYDDSGWEAATIYTKAQVGPKDGYDRISWDSSAQFAWSGNLFQDNTVLCRLKVDKP